MFDKETLDAKEIMELTGLYQKNYNPDLQIYDSKKQEEVKECEATEQDKVAVEENAADSNVENTEEENKE